MYLLAFLPALQIRDKDNHFCAAFRQATFSSNNFNQNVDCYLKHERHVVAAGYRPWNLGLEAPRKLPTQATHLVIAALVIGRKGKGNVQLRLI